jgi:protein O-GlcNAc transferase
VDLAGHTAGNRLRVFALKPAPVQVTWLGYMNTTGLQAIDYRLTDEVLDPPEKCDVRSAKCEVESVSSSIAPRPSPHDTEQLFRMPRGFCCFAPPSDAPLVAPLPALREGRLTFGSLSSLLKLNTQVVNLWSRVLQAVLASRLVLFHHTLTNTAAERIRKEFADAGIANDRLDLRRGSYGPGYLGVYSDIDISLDTYPYTGGVTTCESLWMGVPVITLCGVRPPGRNSAALLARAGLSEWVAQTPEEYVALAARQADNLDQLAKLRTQLRDRVNETLCDAEGFTRKLEQAYSTMWRRWCAGLSK